MNNSESLGQKFGLGVLSGTWRSKQNNLWWLSWGINVVLQSNLFSKSNFSNLPLFVVGLEIKNGVPKDFSDFRKVQIKFLDHAAHEIFNLPICEFSILGNQVFFDLQLCIFITLVK